MEQAIETRPTTPEVVDLPARSTAVVRIEGPAADLPRMMSEAFSLTMGAISAAGASFAGHPFARYETFGPRIVAEVGFPFSGMVTPGGRVHVRELPGGRAVMTRHVGSYDTIGDAWRQVQVWMTEHDLVSSGAPWEAYLTGPDEPGPPVTEIFFPIR